MDNSIKLFEITKLCNAYEQKLDSGFVFAGESHDFWEAFYVVSGSLDVTCDVTLAPWEAVFGAKKRVPTLDGEVEMNIPAGSSSGRKLRIRGRGLGPESGRGDEYVSIAVSVPSPESLSEDQLVHWKALAELAEK